MRDSFSVQTVVLQYKTSASSYQICNLLEDKSLREKTNLEPLCDSISVIAEPKVRENPLPKKTYKFVPDHSANLHNARVYT